MAEKMALLILIGNWLGAWSDCTDSWKLTEQTGTTRQLGTRGLSGKEEIPGILEQVGIYSCQVKERRRHGLNAVL